MAKTSLVLTVLGEDRPGLVDALAQAVAEHGGNWIESRMARLAGHFAGILRVELDAAEAEALTVAINGLASGGLESVVHTDVAERSDSDTPLVHLALVGQDRPGIVREVSRVLAALDVNVEELNTQCSRAANTGQEIFQADAQLRLPASVTIDTLRHSLEQVAADMMVDLTLE